MQRGPLGRASRESCYPEPLAGVVARGGQLGGRTFIGSAWELGPLLGDHLLEFGLHGGVAWHQRQLDFGRGPRSAAAPANRKGGGRACGRECDQQEKHPTGSI
jgi:hypothetical protein